MAGNFVPQLLHPRDRRAQIPPPTLHLRINHTAGRFWVSIKEFNGCVRQILCDIERIKKFCTFVINNYNKIRPRRLIHGHIKIFMIFFRILLKKNL